MPDHVRLVHKVLEGRYHVYTSPDVKGLHVTADTQAEAQRSAISMLHLIAKELGIPAPVAEFTELANAA